MLGAISKVDGGSLFARCGRRYVRQNRVLILKKRGFPHRCKLVALANVYDALTSNRVHKQAFTHDIPCNIILEGDCKHFDPQIVQAYMAIEDEFVAIRERFNKLALVPA